MDDTGLETATTDALERELRDGEALVARIRARQLRLLGVIDRRQVPGSDGCRSLVEWTSGRLDVSPETARVLARTARAVADLPGVWAALASGAVTFDRAVETAKLATPATEAETLEDTRGLDVAGVRRLAARLHRFTRGDEHAVFSERSLTIQPDLDESSWRLWGALPGYAGRIVDKALTERADTLPALPDGSRDPFRRRRADALVAMAHDSLAGGTGDGEDRSTVVASVFVDAAVAAPTNGEAGVTIEAGPRVGPETLEAVMCVGTVEVTAVGDRGVPVGVGAAGRVVPGRLREGVRSFV